MRTTITLDADIDAKLRALSRERGIPFKHVVNEALRRGLAHGEGERIEPYVIQARPMHALVDLTHATRLAGELEDDEIARKLALRR